MADAPSGSTSQARSGVPSWAVVCTSARLPGSSPTPPGAGSTAGSWSAAAASRRTGVGGASTVARSANSVDPSGETVRSVYAPVAVSRVSEPSAVSSRKTGERPSWSAAKNTTGAPGAGETTCGPGQASKPGSRSRPASCSSVAETSQSVKSCEASQVLSAPRFSTSERLSAVNTGWVNS
ncbi:hypothetical protein ACFQZC_07125 [Streptacidiphilus monticola]